MQHFSSKRNAWAAAGRSALAVAALGGSAAFAQSPAPAAPDMPSEFVFSNARRIADDTLSSIRGGYETSTGLTISFGIERSLVVGSAPMSATRFNIVSSGVTTTVPALASVVQNNVDGQTIRAVTTIDITANTMQVLKQGNVQSLVGATLPALLQR